MYCVRMNSASIPTALHCTRTTYTSDANRLFNTLLIVHRRFNYLNNTQQQCDNDLLKFEHHILLYYTVLLFFLILFYVVQTRNMSSCRCTQRRIPSMTIAVMLEGCWVKVRYNHSSYIWFFWRWKQYHYSFELS